VRIKITADSTCDLSKELQERYDITVQPLTVIRDGVEYLDGVTITPQDIFDHVAAGGALCTTAAVSIGEYEDFFAPYAREYDGVIHLNIGSGFSSCYQNAVLAAGSFNNVRAVDSQNLSTGYGLVVLEAARLAQEMDDLDEICTRLNDFATRVEASFILKQLNYLAKGGRCSTVAALGANLLNLRPCIEVKDGKMVVGKKYRGPYEKCLVSYIKERLTDREDIRYERIFLTHTTMKESDLQAAREALKEFDCFLEVLETTAGCSVSCHCGPDTLGVLFVRK